MDEFEKIFKSTHDTVKSKGITQDDVDREIANYKKEKARMRLLTEGL